MEPEGKIAADLSHAGYRGLFLAGDHSLARSIWGDGGNLDALMEVARSERYSDLERVLAAEVLFANDVQFPPCGWEDLLGSVYARALAITGTGDRPIVLTGNEWGFLYHGRGDGGLGTHLLAAGDAAVRHLLPLLDDPASIFYEGSQEAMMGGSLRYRVKDAAAYFIGKLTGVAMPFHEAIEQRDEEIAQLRTAVASWGHDTKVR
jgi:hypothetical protein